MAEPITLLNVVDSAVKIGLGALVAAVAGFATIKANHKREREKARQEWKRQKLEKLVEEIMAHHALVTTFCAKLHTNKMESKHPFQESAVLPGPPAILTVIDEINNGMARIKTQVSLVGSPEITESLTVFQNASKRLLECSRIDEVDEPKFGRLLTEFSDVTAAFSEAAGRGALQCF